MTQTVGILLFILANCLAYPYLVEFREWIKRRCRIAKRCRLRRKAIRTNLRLYKQTGEDYYIERVKALGRKTKGGRR